MQVTVVYDKLVMEVDSRLDLLVNEIFVAELKAIEIVAPIFEARLISCMKLLQKPQGLMINFFTDTITKSMKPFVNECFKALPDE